MVSHVLGQTLPLRLGNPQPTGYVKPPPTATFADMMRLSVGLGGPPDPAKDPYSAYRYLDTRRETIIQSYHQRPMLRVWDENHEFIGHLTGEKSVQAEELYADTGSAGVVIRKNAWLSDFLLHDRRAEQDLHLTIDPVPTQQDWPLRWGGKVTSINGKRDSRGIHTVELQAAHNREHLKHVLALANPLFPPELQIPKMWILPMNCRSALTVSLWVNLARMFFPLLSIPANIFNPAAWLGTDIENLNPRNWPIQAQYLNPFFDVSRFEVFAAKAVDFHTASATILQDAGCIWRGYTWLTTDPTSPHPELSNLGDFFGLSQDPGPIGIVSRQLAAITRDLSRPTRNCVVLACEDKSGVTGMTGTAIDGPINLIATSADNLITSTLVPQYDANGDGQTDPLIAKWFGAAPAPPWVIFGDNTISQIIESNRTQHCSTATTVYVGGRSPAWVNQLISFGIKYALAQLSAIIQASIFGSYQVPGTPGLDELYQGQLDDTVLAYQRNSDLELEIYAGDLAYKESMNNASSTAYTIAGVLGLRDEHWKTRAYTSFKTKVRIGPYVPGLDFSLGDRVGFMMANIMYVDQVAGIGYSYDENTPLTWEISVGTDNNEQDPVTKALRGLSGIWNLFGMAMGSTELF